MRTLTAMFDNRADAENARGRLASAGISDDDVTIHDQTSLGGRGDGVGTMGGATGDTDGMLERRDRDGDGDRETGMWQSVKNFFSGDEHVYEEGLRRGGFLLTARVDDDRVDAATDILDVDGSVDLDQRSSEWRNEGWQDADRDGTGVSRGDMRPGDATRANTMVGQDRTGTDSDRLAQGGAMGEGQSIPLVEEQLSVGKRETSRGGVRVRSYVVETPVHEDVRLRTERVEVERRPVTGAQAMAPGDVDAMLREQTVEVRETSEEAVVSKTAVVREEVAISKTVDERVERIDDTVRRTEVDIERMDDMDGDRGTTR